MTDIPQLAWPVRLNAAGSDFVYVDQDSPAEHAQAAALVLSTPAGSLVDEPGFGIPDPLFGTGGPDTAAMQKALRDWEPRLPVDIAAQAIQDRAQEIDVTVNEAASG